MAALVEESGKNMNDIAVVQDSDSLRCRFYENKYPELEEVFAYPRHPPCSSPDPLSGLTLSKFASLNDVF